MINKALNLASKRSGIPKQQILCKSRKDELVDARQAIVFALSSKGLTLKQIAKAMGYKEHSAIWHLINKRPIQDSDLVQHVVSGMHKRNYHSNNLVNQQ